MDTEVLICRSVVVVVGGWLVTGCAGAGVVVLVWW